MIWTIIIIVMKVKETQSVCLCRLGRLPLRKEGTIMLLSSADNMRDADRRAITEEPYKIPSIALMEKASHAVAEAAIPWLRDGGCAVILCGSGNNGGDGVGAAVELKKAGYPVRVLLTGSRDHTTPDWREMARRLEALGTCVEDFDPDRGLGMAAVVIDAIFGIGLNKSVGGRALAAIEAINAAHTAGAGVVSADIASGVEADTGRILGAAVRSDCTVTFSMAKPGHFAEPGCTFCGRLTIADIGIPGDILAACGSGVHAVLDEDVSLPHRNPLSHKGDYGKVLVLGGSVGYTGAPTLCARSAVRSGAGLVYLGVPAPIYNITAMKNDEAMPFSLPDGKDGLSPLGVDTAVERLAGMDVCAAGPGLGRSRGTVALVDALLHAESGSGIPLVLDADALSALQGHLEWLREHAAPVILTPHEGEFVRMGGLLTGNRVEDARRFAAAHGCVLVLKGHRCIAAFPDGEAYIATRGNPGMAKGGSGDVLTGIVAALCAQFPGAEKRAVTTAMQLHALAGDLCKAALGEYAMTATDMIAMLPEATIKLMEG